MPIQNACYYVTFDCGVGTVAKNSSGFVFTRHCYGLTRHVSLFYSCVYGKVKKKREKERKTNSSLILAFYVVSCWTSKSGESKNITFKQARDTVRKGSVAEPPLQCVRLFSPYNRYYTDKCLSLHSFYFIHGGANLCLLSSVILPC